MSGGGAAKRQAKEQRRELARQQAEARARERQMAREREEQFGAQRRRQRGRIGLISDIAGLGQRTSLGGE